MRKEIAERLDEWGMPPIPAIQFAQEMKNRQREAERGLRMRRLCRMQSYLTPRPYPKPCEFPKFFIGMHKGSRCAVLRTTSGDVKLPFVSMQFREVR